jgi:hypothetical protein
MKNEKQATKNAKWGGRPILPFCVFHLSFFVFHSVLPIERHALLAPAAAASPEYVRRNLDRVHADHDLYRAAHRADDADDHGDGEDVRRANDVPDGIAVSVTALKAEI